MTTDDDLELPAFMKRTPERQAAIDAWNTTHPATPCSFVDPKVVENIERRKVELKEAARVASIKSKVRKETRTVLEATKVESRGKVWRDGQWVDPGFTLSRADYDRILRELPTARHKQIFVDKYSDKVRKGKRAA